VSTASKTVRTGLVQQSLPSPEDESHRGMLSAAWIRRVSCVHEDGRSQYVDREIHVVVDNLGTHFTAEVRDWLADNPNITFHRTPVGAPWINQIEIWFGLITRQAIRRGTFSSVKQLITTIENYIANWNANCKPFTWTAAADTILAKVRWIESEVRSLRDTSVAPDMYQAETVADSRQSTSVSR